MRNEVSLYYLAVWVPVQQVKLSFMMIRGNGMGRIGKKFFLLSGRQLGRMHPCSLIQSEVQRWSMVDIIWISQHKRMCFWMTRGNGTEQCGGSWVSMNSDGILPLRLSLTHFANCHCSWM